MVAVRDNNNRGEPNSRAGLTGRDCKPEPNNLARKLKE
tara:strand:+ start:731 stop:844 length:114 start_codon:yes stop_codon:yes gene_type:complete